MRPKPDSTVVNLTTGKTTGESHTAVGRASAAIGNDVQVTAGAKDKITSAEMKAALPLSKVGKPEQTLSTAKIDDRAGISIGDVHEVVLDGKGDPTALHVDVGGLLGVGERMVAINASHFSYLPKRNILVANLTKNQIKALPPIKEPSGIAK